jgi:hypothetical protein
MEVVTINLQKSSSDTGKVDHEVWSNIKNYPRRNYLSPADCRRRVNTESRQLAGTKNFTNNNSPPVSYLGWNMPTVVVETITPAKPQVKKASENGVPRQNGLAHQNGNATPKIDRISGSKSRTRLATSGKQSSNGGAPKNGNASTRVAKVKAAHSGSG